MRALYRVVWYILKISIPNVQNFPQSFLFESRIVFATNLNENETEKGAKNKRKGIGWRFTNVDAEGLPQSILVAAAIYVITKEHTRFYAFGELYKQKEFLTSKASGLQYSADDHIENSVDFPFYCHF